MLRNLNFAKKNTNIIIYIKHIHKKNNECHEILCNGATSLRRNETFKTCVCFESLRYMNFLQFCFVRIPRYEQNSRPNQVVTYHRSGTHSGSKGIY